jgi:hypothetical protein
MYIGPLVKSDFEKIMFSVFISYAHVDELLAVRFQVHLTALLREGLIKVWNDRLLLPGQLFDSAIERELAAADLVIPLISPDFIYSNYCMEKEMQLAFARAKSGACRLMPVIIEPCQWRNVPIGGGGRLGDFTALPRGEKPVSMWLNQNAAFDDVIAAIRNSIVRP